MLDIEHQYQPSSSSLAQTWPTDRSVNGNPKLTWQSPETVETRFDVTLL
jgi:hypothetical protein